MLLDVFRPTDSGLHPSQAFSVRSWHRSGKIHITLSLPLCLSTASSHADPVTLLEAEEITVEFRENPWKEIMKRAQERDG